MELRGEVFLSFKDISKINSEISPFGFQFEEHVYPAPPVQKPAAAPPKKVKSEKAPIKYIPQVSVKSESSERLPNPNRSRRSVKTPIKYEDSDSEDSGSSYSRMKRLKSLYNDRWGQYRSDSNFVSRFNQLRGTNRKEIPKGEALWRNACLKIIQTQRKKPYSSIFARHFSESSQQVYIDLDIIESNLQNGKYSNPFWWQHDMRQLCYIIFQNFKPEHEIWHQARQFLVDFEAQCKDLEKVNPYCKTTALEIIEAPPKPVSYDTTKRDSHKMDQSYYYSDESSYSDMENWKAPQISYSKDKKKKKRTAKSPTRRSGIKGSFAMDDAAAYHLYQTAPEFGPILDPPGIQKISSNDRPLNSTQRKALDHNMSLLAPNQRKAVLELIQDDLGILAESHMHDKNFSFDIELISIEKQKRVFTYVNKLIRANLEMIQASKGHKMEPDNPFSQEFLKLKPDTTLSKPSEIFDNVSSSSSSDYESDKEIFESIISANANQSCSTNTPNTSKSNDSLNTNKNDTVNNGYDNVGDAQQNVLPEYSPVVDEKEKLEIGDIVGKGPGFFATIQNYQAVSTSAPSTSSAWPEWKGQVIQQGLVSQNGVPPRSADEKIAEGFDARI